MSNSFQRRKLKETSFLIGGTGDPLLLLHGIPGSAYSWEKTGSLLTDHFQVIIPDLRGFGQSTRSSDDFYMEAQAVALRQLLKALDVEQLSVGAHDFGGPVALTLQHLYPVLRIKKFVLSATNLFTDTHVPPPLRLAGVPVLGDLFFWMAAGNRIGLRIMYAAAAHNKAEFTMAEYNRHLTESGVDLTRRIFQRSLADLEENYKTIEEMLPGIDQPVLVLWGDKDPFFSTAVAERTSMALRNAILKIYQDTGHFVPEERSERVAEDLVSFLKADPSRSLSGTEGGAA